MDDDLGSFFAEIEKIDVPAEVVGTSSLNDIATSVSIATEVITKQPERSYRTIETHVSPPPVNASIVNESEKYTPNIKVDDPSQSSVYSGYTLNQLPSAPTHTHVPQPPPPPPVPRQNKKFVRTAAEEVWIDESLNEWPENDYRIFVGDLAKEVSTEHLTRHFQQYKSFAKAKVLRTKHENKARGYGFVSFLDPMDCAKAIREQNGKYLLSRPMKITKSTWKDREIKEVKKKEHKKRKIQESLGLA